MSSLLRYFRILVVFVAMTCDPISASSQFIAQLTPKSWTGVMSNQFEDPLNWLPHGVPGKDDSIIIPLDKQCVVSNSTVNLGAIHILSGGKITFNQGGMLVVEGSTTIDSGGTFQISGDLTAYFNDFRVLGKLNIAPGGSPRLSIRGNFDFASATTFNPGRSTIIFVRPNGTVFLPPLNYYNLVVDSVGAMESNGSMQILNQIDLQLPFTLRSVDTMYVLSGDTAAITGHAEITEGTIVRAIDTLALSGGTYRFHDHQTSVNFFRQGTPPEQITMTSVPGIFPQNLDTNLVFRHYFDIHQVGGSNFRLTLSFEYDTREVGPASLSDRFSIYRSPDYGATWFEIPATSVDTVNHIIRADSITGFSRYGFGRGTPTATDIKEKKEIVRKFALAQNYPNPFNPSTTISYSIGEATDVVVRVFNLLGQEVATLVSERNEVGDYSVTWDAGNIASGVYVCKLITPQHSLSRKLMLLK